MEIKFATHLSKRKGEDCHHEEEFTWKHPNFEDKVTGSFFALLDGHSGMQTAEFAKDNLLKEFLLQLDGLPLADEYDGSPCKSTRQAFDVLHCNAISNAFVEINNQCQAQFDRSGATCTVVLILREQQVLCKEHHRVFATVANVGDSHVYCLQNGNMTRLNEDHRAGANKHENKRVEETKGWELSKKADPKGPLRLFPGGLMMTRSLGDVEAGACCTGEPAVTRICTTKCRLILASDGLWDALGMKEITKVACGKPDVVQCSRHLMMDASKREGKKFGDDVTVTVIDIGDFKNEKDEGDGLWVWKPFSQNAPEPVRLISALRNEGFNAATSEFVLGSEVVLDGNVKSGLTRITQIDFGGELFQLAGTKKWVAVNRLSAPPPVEQVVEEKDEQVVEEIEPEIATEIEPKQEAKRSKPSALAQKKTHILPLTTPTTETKKKPDEVAHMFFCTGFPKDWALKDLKAFLEVKFKSRLSRCTFKTNPDMPEERGLFFSLAKRVSFGKVCKTHELDNPGGEQLVVVRTRDAFPEFYTSTAAAEEEEEV